VNAVEIRIKYDTPDFHGYTQRRIAELIDFYGTPQVVIPEHGEYLWNWFWDIVSPASYIRDGEALTLTHNELRCWQQNMGLKVRPFEFDCLMQMSRAWSRAMSVELTKIREQQAKGSK
jgi:hypothetical protein